MKNKIMCLLLSVALITMVNIENVEGAVYNVAVTTVKSGDTINTYVKNNDNHDSAIVELELQKNGKTISSQSVGAKKNEQTKVKFTLTSSGTYKIKYTFNGKSNYTGNFTKK